MIHEHNILLIPGFFGFENLGDVRYFNFVKKFLEVHFERAGMRVHVVEVPTPPTASVRHRAARVLEALAEVATTREGLIHLVGHSTGGLDARLAVIPTASLPTQTKLYDYHRIRSIVTVSTPHYGTPSAAFFGGLLGKPLLRTMALGTAYSLRFGRVPLTAGLLIGKFVARADDYFGLRNTVLDFVVRRLLPDLSETRRKALVGFMNEIASDQSLIFQLTPEGLDLFNATTACPVGMRYGSVVTCAPRPSPAPLLRYRHDVYAYLMYALYTFFYVVASRTDANNVPELTPAQLDRLRALLPKPVDGASNDGMIPTLSQVWGEVIHAAEADHFDALGHFDDPFAEVQEPQFQAARKASKTRTGRTTSRDRDESEHPHDAHHHRFDWLASGSHFSHESFDTLWASVVAFMLREK